MGFAEATLTLDNTDRAFHDADEVMVTRRYYRSGDSEFLHQQAVGPAAGHPRAVYGHRPGPGGIFNVSQGRIDEILAVKAQTAGRFF